MHASTHMHTCKHCVASTGWQKKWGHSWVDHSHSDVFGGVKDCVLVPLQHSYVEALPRNGMVLGGVTFGRQSSHANGAPMMESVFSEEKKKSWTSPSSLPEDATRRQLAVCKPGTGPPQNPTCWHPDLGLPVSTHVRKINVCCLNYSICHNLLWKSKMTKIKGQPFFFWFWLEWSKVGNEPGVHAKEAF